MTLHHKSRGFDISPRNSGVFQCVDRDQLRVGDRVRVYAGAISCIAGQRGVVVEIPEPLLYRVRSDGGVVRLLARRDLAVE